MFLCFFLRLIFSTFSRGWWLERLFKDYLSAVVAIGISFNDDLGTIEAESPMATRMENRIRQLFHANVAELHAVFHKHGRFLLLISFYQHLDCSLFVFLVEPALWKVWIYCLRSGVSVPLVSVTILLLFLRVGDSLAPTIEAWSWPWKCCCSWRAENGFSLKRLLYLSLFYMTLSLEILDWSALSITLVPLTESSSSSPCSSFKM